jgi:hypothetical protein
MMATMQNFSRLHMVVEHKVLPCEVFSEKEIALHLVFQLNKPLHLCQNINLLSCVNA